MFLSLSEYEDPFNAKRSKSEVTLNRILKLSLGSTLLQRYCEPRSIVRWHGRLFSSLLSASCQILSYCCVAENEGEREGERR